MKRISYTILLFVVMTFAMSNKSGKRVSMIGKEVPSFCLQNIDGKYIATDNYKNAKGFIVVFTCNHCPFAKLYTQRLNALNAKYSKLGVPLLAVNPMDSLVYENETLKGMKAWAKEKQFRFPYLKDGSQQVAKSFYALHTPQAFVIWRVNSKWIVKYSGAIDDNGQHPEKAKSFIANAVDDLLQGKEVAEPENLSFGCAIHYRQ
ncbi:MAG: thioredoxin family protein [Bacteroidetes bacterium]|nr:thioredoxin family protein [Bacteroidota bacterium]